MVSSSTPEHTALIRERLEQCPVKPGVYHMLSATGKVLYVGKAIRLKNRVRSYFREGGAGLSPRISMMVANVRDIVWFVTANEDEALILENSHIKSLNPKYNILFRDDKSYPYLRFSSDEFPRVSVYRGRQKKQDGCFGPFASSGAVHETITLMQRVFQLRTCEDSVFRHRTRPCLLHQIHRCSAPCVGKINADEYHKAVGLAKAYVQGHQPQVFEQLDQAMHEASARLDFERAAQIRDQLSALRVTASSQRVIGHADDFCDLIACVPDDEHGLFALSFRAIREGEPVDEQSVVQSNPQAALPEEIIAEYLRYRYSQHQAPKKIYVSHWSEVLPKGRAQEYPDWPIMVPGRAREKEWMARLITQAQTALSVAINSRERSEQSLSALQEWLSLPVRPTRMECIDISHLGGEHTVGSWVVFVDGKPQPRDYRRYNLSIRGGDDVAAICEMVSRRFSAYLNTPKDDGQEDSTAESANDESPEANAKPIPDVLIIDGGAMQVRAVKKLIDTSQHPALLAMPFFGLSKGPERIEGNEVLVFPNGRTLQSSLAHAPFKLLLAVRDEAHRFALTGQRASRKKKIASHLEALEGIGPHRRRKLIARFGSFAGVRHATIEQLQQVEGISASLAQKIYAQCHME